MDDRHVTVVNVVKTFSEFDVILIVHRR